MSDPLGTGVTLELSHGYKGSRLGSLEEKPMILSTELSLWHLFLKAGITKREFMQKPELKYHSRI